MRPVAAFAVLLALAAPTALFGQQPVPAPAPAAPAAPAAPRAAQAPRPVTPARPVSPGAVPAPAPPTVTLEPNQPGQLVNIQIDITLTSEGGTQPMARKTVTLTLADKQEGSVRSLDRGTGPGGNLNPAGSLNVDARPVMQTNGRVLTRIGLEFSGGDDVPFVQVRAQPLLESGRALRISRAVSPRTDRTVTVEVTATVLK